MKKSKYFHKPNTSRIIVLLILVALTIAFGAIFVWNTLEQIKVAEAIKDIKKDSVLKQFKPDKVLLFVGLGVAGYVMLTGALLVTYTNKAGLMLISFIIALIAIAFGSLILSPQDKVTDWTGVTPKNIATGVQEHVVVPDYILKNPDAVSFFGNRYEEMQTLAKNINLTMKIYGSFSILFGVVMIVGCGMLFKSRRMDILMDRKPSHAGDQNSSKNNYDPMEV